MLSKIISGGQTGADRAALDAGLEAGFPIGGACPAGRMAEDGPISDSYPLVEISGGYRQRTRKNVEDSDGTAIFYKSYLKGGTELTAIFCVRLGKPYKLIDIELVNPETAAALLARFVKEFDIEVLNTAGPRQSGCPEMYEYVKQAIGLVIKQSTY
ncbi:MULTISPECIES: putative molybdenum carrier protein [unclassified Microbulbifer]|uniref:putative molybdenum carrier protein n=1 Tax=unclassified Microbulbifer TaxID=2619833 RepID=UPI0027E3DF9C|nr:MULTISPECIES: putative molybdenum carrier protein [unclassified Microbulbifer]